MSKNMARVRFCKLIDHSKTDTIPYSQTLSNYRCDRKKNFKLLIRVTRSGSVYRRVIQYYILWLKCMNRIVLSTQMSPNLNLRHNGYTGNVFVWNSSII